MCDGQVSLKPSQCNLFSRFNATLIDNSNLEGLAICYLGGLVTADGLDKTHLQK